MSDVYPEESVFQTAYFAHEPRLFSRFYFTRGTGTQLCDFRGYYTADGCLSDINHEVGDL